jgi:hypothetical protein
MRNLANFKTKCAVVNFGVSSLRVLGDKILAVPHSTCLSINSQKYLKWDHVDRTLRLYATDTEKMLAIFKNPHVDHVTAAVFVDNDTLLTTGNDSVQSNILIFSR